MNRIHLADPVLGLQAELSSFDDDREVIDVRSWAGLRQAVEEHGSSTSETGLAAIAVVPPVAGDGALLDEIARDVDEWKRAVPLSLVLVVSDELLGTDGRVAHAGFAAGTLALSRSVAIYRGTAMRMNIVACSGHLFGAGNGQRGPLAATTGVDIAHAADFLVGPQAGYINGQVLYADGGRQLFSSLSA